MNLKDLGYNNELGIFNIEENQDDFDIGRVISEHKERYIVKTIKGEFKSEITGNLRYAANSREDYPAVGDWVALTTYNDFALIHKIYPRTSTIKRKAVHQFGEIQMIATNIDCAFIVQAIDRDFNINRLERYLTICHESRVKPIIVLSKIDLIDEFQLKEILDNINERIKNVSIVKISNETLIGYDELYSFIEKGKTYCLLGSSGVGKSTLLNNLSDKTMMRTDSISESTNKGKHITSHRELFILDNGGIIIDNPGMREVGIADSERGLEITFDKIFIFSQRCKFKDCTHTHEVGCSVLESVENGEIDKASYDNYIKMEKERTHFETTITERRKKDKEFGKMLKNYKKDMKRMKYKT